MHRETKKTSISPEVKSTVYLRDHGLCVICGEPGAPVAHVVRRSAGGLGIEQNIITVCNNCHYALDEGLNLKRLNCLGFFTQSELKQYVRDYMMQQYPGWTEESVKYHKYNFGVLGNGE